MLRPLCSNRRPVDQAIEVVAGKWKPLILWRLHAGTLRFAQLQRAIPQVTQRMLTLQLRELERDGLVQRLAQAQRSPRVEYVLTEPGRSLMPVLESLGHWLLERHGELRRQGESASRPRGTLETCESMQGNAVK